MADAGLRINVTANVVDALRSLGTLNDNLEDLAYEGTGNIQSLKTALNDLRTAAASAGNTQELTTFNRAIRDLNAEQNRLKQVGLKDNLNDVSNSAGGASKSMGLLGLSMGQSRVAFLDLGRAVTGQGFTLRSLASNFALLGPVGTIAVAAIYGLYEVLNKTTDAEKKAQEEAKHLKEVLFSLKDSSDISLGAAGGAQGEIALVRDLAAAVQDTNKSYKERRQALEQLQQINKSYFGDLTLEASSMGVLTQRVKEYADALVTQAIIKGQTEEIAKMSEELFKQVKIEDQLKDARDRANADVAKYSKSVVDNQKAGYEAGAKYETAFYEKALADASKTQDAFAAQRDAVLKLRSAIADYNGELNKNVGIQLTERPLKDQTDKEEKSLESLLSKILQVKAELAKPVNAPIFEQFAKARDAQAGGDIFAVFQKKIADALKEGQKIGTAEGSYYAHELADLYARELSKIANPDLHAHFAFALEKITPDQTDKMETEIERAFHTRGLKFNVPLDVKQTLKEEGFNKEAEQVLLKKKAEEALAGAPPIRWNPDIQIAIDAATLKKEFKEQLVDNLNKIINDTATSGIESVGKAIGFALAKGANPLAEAGKAIVEAIGGLIEQMGQGLIKYGAEVALMKAILSVSPFDLIPGVAIAAGIAMVAIGELVKKTFKATPFAEGGIVTGPTLGLIGEVPGSPEAILPLNRIGDFLSNLPGQQPAISGNLSATLRGQDLLLVQERATKNRSIGTGLKTGI